MLEGVVASLVLSVICFIGIGILCFFGKGMLDAIEEAGNVDYDDLEVR